MAKYDVAIRGGRVVDGASNPWYYSDIGVREGKIVRIGSISGSDADRVFDASGLVVCPGFIDLHTHSDVTVGILASVAVTEFMVETTGIQPAIRSLEYNGMMGFGGNDWLASPSHPHWNPRFPSVIPITNFGILDPRYRRKVELEAPGLAELPTEHQLPGERLGIL